MCDHPELFFNIHVPGWYGQAKSHLNHPMDGGSTRYYYAQQATGPQYATHLLVDEIASLRTTCFHATRLYQRF